MKRMRKGLGVIAVASVLMLAGCGSAARGDIATWELRDAASVTASTTELEVLVTRLGCANGETGDVHVPQVSYENDRVIVRIDVEPLPSGAYNCQGNDAVPVTVSLSEPLGDRLLVDGACAEADAAITVFCGHDGVRWG
ncbi:hypothetical protein [Microbacterium sp. NIBRBAC000506063]|uniref:hypothetical protein n=1 Tax=Microbacterium sp. NIBRBAC000506063 TaxID=2734618 RepID=UPI001BB7A4E0|nr:hypothetical protein [Microbacterium sp. NIBRBAC000506063]QTV79195.1 hypothetical protein KAE78_08985 [Microbacterium sp. NIBRBAC000506063]